MKGYLIEIIKLLQDSVNYVVWDAVRINSDEYMTNHPEDEKIEILE